MNQNPTRFRLARICQVGASMAFVFLAGCPAAQSPNQQDKPPESPDQQDNQPEPTAAKLFTMITETDPYEQWAQFPEAQGIIDSAPPHGEQSEVRINDAVVAAMDSFSGALPDGSVIVKRNTGDQEQNGEALTIMWKVAGFNPENNDWFWANMTLDGQVVAEGNIEGCIGCHSGARDNDFVFLHQFGEAMPKTPPPSLLREPAQKK